jgi:hypothetical protein
MNFKNQEEKKRGKTDQSLTNYNQITRIGEKM